MASTSFQAYDRARTKDERAVGTPAYRGIAYFWNYEYRHYLRDCSRPCRKRAHDALLRAGLALDGESAEHEAIIRRYIEKDPWFKRRRGR